MPLHLELITPERTVSREEFDQVTLPTQLGEITVLPNHAPLVATLVPGIAKLVRGGKTEELAVSGGFIEISEGNHVRVLADTAERGTELDLSVIETAKRRAEDVMHSAVSLDDKSFAMAAAGLERELARERVARKHLGAHHLPTLDATKLPSNENPV